MAKTINKNRQRTFGATPKTQVPCVSQTLKVPMLKGDKPGKLSNEDAACTMAGCTIGYLGVLGVDVPIGEYAFTNLQVALNALIDLVAADHGVNLIKVSVLPTKAMHKDAISLTALTAEQLDSLALSPEHKRVFDYWSAWFMAELAWHCPDTVRATWKLEAN